MDDQAFLAAFEQGQLTYFPHRDHIRMAWLYIRANGWETAQRKICEGLQHFASVHHAPGKYHVTITLFWAHRVKAAVDQAPHLTQFDDFISQYPSLLDSGVIKQYYSPALLMSTEARQGWLDPDLQPLPSDDC